MRMTIQEAIKRINEHMSIHHIGQYPHIHLADALHMALDALREKAEREDPKPLTLEELRQMDGEPVWVVDLKEKACCGCCVISISKPLIYQDTDHYNAAYIPGIEHTWYEFRDYGKEWTAYRHKPVEVEPWQ